jgi:hypothetical protein
VVALAVALRRRERAALVAIAVLFGPLVLQSSLLVNVVNELAERMLYPASAAATALLVVVIARRVAQPRRRAALLAVIAAAYAAQLVRVERAWRSDIALWSYAVTVEPRAIASQSGYGTALIHQGHYGEAAWHRMLERYLERGYPSAIDWTPVERLEASPIEVRLLEGPALLAPGAECDFTGEWLRAVTRELPDLTRRLAPAMAEHYRCRR